MIRITKIITNQRMRQDIEDIFVVLFVGYCTGLNLYRLITWLLE